jgi:hypothetical protein
MQEDESGASQSRLETNQGTPKEISSTPGEMNVSQTNTTPSGTRKKRYLLECDEDIVTGETNYCRRIPLYDEPIPGTVTDGLGTPPTVSSIASRQATANGGCTSPKCDISSRLVRNTGQSSTQKVAGRRIPNKD